MAEKRITSYDVAKLAGVSRTTVSFVLNHVSGPQISPETTQRVFDAARELGYVPDEAARALVSRSSKSIGLVLSRSSHHITSDVFLNQIVEGLLNVVHQHKMRLILDVVEDSGDKDTYLNLIKGKRIDGLILSGPRFDDEALDYLAETNFPTVLMGRLPNSYFCSVDVDNVSAASVAVEHLARLGHKRIACITNAPPSFTAAVDRLEGYRQALMKNGLPYNEALVRFGNFGPESGYNQMLSLLEVNPRPTAVFIASDVVAFGAITAIQKLGLRIPQDIALVGFDDVPMSSFVTPPLTTVRLPAMDLALKAGEVLLNLIREKQQGICQVLLDTELVVRQSCGARPDYKFLPAHE
jgi:LacI family transcriptional regulator